jgi:hypothetical protein
MRPVLRDLRRTRHRKNTARPRLEAFLKSLEGDTFVVWRLDELGNNLADPVRQRDQDHPNAAQNSRYPVCQHRRRFGVARSTLDRAVLKRDIDFQLCCEPP